MSGSIPSPFEANVQGLLAGWRLLGLTDPADINQQTIRAKSASLLSSILRDTTLSEEQKIDHARFVDIATRNSLHALEPVNSPLQSEALRRITPAGLRPAPAAPPPPPPPASPDRPRPAEAESTRNQWRLNAFSFAKRNSAALIAAAVGAFAISYLNNSWTALALGAGAGYALAMSPTLRSAAGLGIKNTAILARNNVGAACMLVALALVVPLTTTLVDQQGGLDFVRQARLGASLIDLVRVVGDQEADWLDLLKRQKSTPLAVKPLFSDTANSSVKGQNPAVTPIMTAAQGHAADGAWMKKNLPPQKISRGQDWWAHKNAVIWDSAEGGNVFDRFTKDTTVTVGTPNSNGRIHIRYYGKNGEEKDGFIQQVWLNHILSSNSRQPSVPIRIVGVDGSKALTV